MLKTTKQWQLGDGRPQTIVIGSNVRFNENGIGNQRPEDPQMLAKISEDQTNQVSLPAPSRARPVVETLLRGAGPPLQIPATSPPASGHHSQHSEEAPESVSDSQKTSLWPSTQYLGPITPSSLRSEVGYEHTIMLAPSAGANTFTREPAKVGSSLAKTSRALQHSLTMNRSLTKRL